MTGGEDSAGKRYLDRKSHGGPNGIPAVEK